MLENGSIVGGKYKVLNVIGKGGMSTVYLAMNERANKQWAIKEVRKDATTNYQIIRQSLITETNLLKELSHPYLPSIVDVLDEDGRFLIVMDYIEGNTLEKALSMKGAQPQEAVIDWGIQLCDVLEYLHTRKPPIIYRDLKPGNIMIKPDGTITLIDFGIAREYKVNKSDDTSYLGTKGYAAPEQFGGKGQTDARTDIYNLGATLYHLVTGHNPSEPPYEFYPIRYWNQQLSPGLEQIITKCVQNNPIDRYQSCAQVMYDLQHYRELDKSYKKASWASMILFTVTLAMSVTAGVLAMSFHQKSISLAKQNYDYYINEAKAETTEFDSFDLYAKAIEMTPDQADGYTELLDNLILIDENLSPEEDERLRQLLIRQSGNMTIEQRLSSNEDAYALISYKLGIAYFYCYDEVGNKQKASKWLKIASESHSLSESQQQRAQKLGKIADYYASMSVESKSGDKKTGYKTYWDDLTQVAEGNIAETDNPTTALIIYKEIATQIYDHPAGFLKDGVSYEEMNEEMNELLTHIDTDILSRTDLSDYTKDLVAKTQMDFAMAKTALDMAVEQN